MLKFIRFLLILNFSFSFLLSFSIYAHSQEDLHFSILHTNDLHSSFLKNYARLAFLIHSIREQNFKEGRETLVLDSGDFSSGSVYQVLTPNPKYPESPELEFFKYAGYDAIGFGNHDFDFGLAGFLNMLKKNRNLDVPFISSNIHFKNPNPLTKQIPPYRIIHKKNIRIGLMAFLGPNAAKVSLNTRTGISFDGYNDEKGKEDLNKTIKVAKETADILKNKEKADIIIMLLHAGKPEDHKIAKALGLKSGVDIIIAGHTHELYPVPEKENDIILAQTSGEGRELGVLKFTYHPKTKKLDLDNPQQIGHIVINENIKEDPHYLRLLHRYDESVEEIFGRSLKSPIFTLNHDYPHSREVGNPLGTLISSSIMKSLNLELIGAKKDSIDVYLEPMAAIRGSLVRTNNKPTPINFSDIFALLSLGYSKDFHPAYPITTLYLDKKDFLRFLNVLEIYRHIEPLFTTAFSDSLTLRIRSWGLPFINRLADVKLHGKTYDEWPALIKIGSSELLSSYIYKLEVLTHGLIKITPRDDKGNPISKALYETEKKEYDFFAESMKKR